MSKSNPSINSNIPNQFISSQKEFKTMSSQRKQLYLGVKLNEDLTDRFRFFQEQSQLNTKDALKLMIIQSTDTLGYLEKKKIGEIAPSQQK